MEEKDAIMLQYIYEEQHLTKASERLFITQPALTYRLQQLEREYGIQILIKNGKGIKFTPEGEYLVSFAHKFLVDIRKTKHHLTNMASEVQGTLKIGAAGVFARYYLPTILKRFVELYPKVTINVSTGGSPNMMDLMDNDSVHVAFIRGDYKWAGPQHLITEENICLISKSEMDLEHLPHFQRIQYSYNLRHSRDFKYTPLTTMSDQIQVWWAERYGEPPITTMQIDSYETCKEMVKNGLGYSIIPSIFINPGDDLHSINLVKLNGEAIKRNTWLLYKESSEQLRVVDKFVEYVKSQRFTSRMV